MKNVHEAPQCITCPVKIREKMHLGEIVTLNEVKMSQISVQNENIVKKNISLEKEVNRLKFVFNESQREKSEISKELNVQRESLSVVIKENTILNEDVRVKAEFIQLIKSQLDKHEANGKTSSNKPDIQVVDDSLSTNSCGQKKCRECNYQTSVPHLLRGHNIAHTGRQY